MGVDSTHDAAGTPAVSLRDHAEWLVARYHWQLVSAADLAALAEAEAQRAGVALSPREADQLITAIYVEHMHQACSGARGPADRDRGYVELWGFLVSVARKKYPDVADHAAQLALSATFEAFDRCHTPRAFLPFAHQRLYTVVRQLRRGAGGSVSLDQSVAEDIVLGDTIAAPHADPVDALLAREMSANVQRAIEQSRELHPRARMQLQAFFGKHLEGLSDAEIAERLQCDVAQVPVLRSRGASKLRQDGHWKMIRDGIDDDPSPAPKADLKSAI